MLETLHINQRAIQGVVTKQMMDITLEYGKLKGDKIRLSIRGIKELLRTKVELKSELLNLKNKGELVMVVLGATLITAYTWR